MILEGKSDGVFSQFGYPLLLSFCFDIASAYHFISWHSLVTCLRISSSLVLPSSSRSVLSTKGRRRAEGRHTWTKEQ